MIKLNLKCEYHKCRNKASYIIIWKGATRPMYFFSTSQAGCICKKHYEQILVSHKHLIQTTIDFADEKVLLT